MNPAEHGAFACVLLPSECDSQLEAIQSQHRNCGWRSPAGMWHM